MKILMIGRKTLFDVPGGDTIQIRMTAFYLQKLGVTVDVRLTSETIEYSHYDLIHFFNIIRPDDILPHISRTSIPYVVSTIFVDYSEYETNEREGLLKIATKLFNSDQLEYMKALARYIKNGDKIRSKFYLLNGHKHSIQHIVERARLLLPNSHNEYNRFTKRYKIKKGYEKVPNAVDVTIFNPDIKPNDLYTNHVLCVGRFEGLKNQLNLIKAFSNSDVLLTFIGKPAPNHLKYFQECKKLVSLSNNIQILDHVNQVELAAIYKAAKVHVLPSWFETTGLSSLEAGAMECNIVVTKKGDTEEYFGNMAEYCEPNDISSIRKAVLKAYHAPVNPLLRNTILKEYTWPITAERTLAAYEAVLGSV